MNDSLARITSVENLFGIHGMPLKQENRKLIGEGILLKMCRKRPKERQFFLFSDILVYGSIIIAKKKLGNQHIIELEEVEIKELEDNSMPYYGFCVKSPKKSFAIYAKSAEEKDQWITHMQSCINDCLKKRGAVGISPIKSPVWIPDVMAPKCMLCKLTVFSLLNRRHHCRCCGIVVCQSCSSKRWLLPYQNRQPQRVCDTCFSKLEIDNNTSFDPSLSNIYANYLPIKQPNQGVNDDSDDLVSDSTCDDSDYDEHQSINLIGLTNPCHSLLMENK